MPTEVMNEHIAKLPKRPIILPCYDRRGCFFAEVLGSELHQAGHDVRGRYTLPWEYFIARARPPHVEAWIAEQNKSIWAKAAAYLAEPDVPDLAMDRRRSGDRTAGRRFAPAGPAVLGQGRARPDSRARRGDRNSKR